MKIIVFLTHFIVLSQLAFGQSDYKNILIDDERQGFFQPCEPSIFINPKNPENIVAGAILDKVYYSEDKGKTWNSKRLESPYGVWGDPVVIADAKGRFYYFHLSAPNGETSRAKESRWLDRIVCQISKNGGKTWTKGTYMGENHPKDQDKHWAVADHKTGNIYATWTQFDLYNSREPGDSTNIMFSMSENQGKTWSEAIRINQIAGDCLDDDNTTEGAVPATGPKGELYVSWCLNEKIYFDKSLDAGKTWLKNDILIAQQPNGWSMDIPGIYRTNGFTVTACDIAKESPYKGTIYVNWSDQRNGKNDTDVWLSKSTNGGKTWSEPKRVNDDKAGKHQFFSWMAVDPVTGFIYVVFYDRRHYEDEQTDVYLAYSTDGGETFTNERISESPFKPSKNVFFGDYNNLSVYDGIVRPIWTRLQDQKLSIWTALIDKSSLKK